MVLESWVAVTYLSPCHPVTHTLGNMSVCRDEEIWTCSQLGTSDKGSCLHVCRNPGREGRDSSRLRAAVPRPWWAMGPPIGVNVEGDRGQGD